MVRNPVTIENLSASGCEIVKGDISDSPSIERAVGSMQAIYVCIHTLSAQHASASAKGFMDVELDGLQNIVAACGTRGIRRLIYISSLGISPAAKSAWVRGRWKVEQFLLNCGLDATIIRPGQIVGIGGQGFGMTVGNAKRRFSLVLGTGQQKMRSIALDDLIYYLIGVLNESATFNKYYDVGSDDVLTGDQMIDVAADVLGLKHPVKLHIPLSFFRAIVPLFERSKKLQKGALRGVADCLGDDMVGDDPALIRTILARPLLSYRQAVERALKAGNNAAPVV